MSFARAYSKRLSLYFGFRERDCTILYTAESASQGEVHQVGNARQIPQAAGAQTCDGFRSEMINKYHGIGL